MSDPHPGHARPVTAQTFGVLVVGRAPVPGVMAAALYLLIAPSGSRLRPARGRRDTFASIGAVGSSAPTGGYLVGFVLAAGLVGRLAEARWDRTIAGSLAAFSPNARRYLVGVPWLAVCWASGPRSRRGLPFLIDDAQSPGRGGLPTAWWVIGKRSTDR
jgi:biotin transport system substrate-specific component